MTGLESRARAYLERLCDCLPDRRLGSPANEAATDFAAEVLRSAGLTVETPSFDCLYWSAGEAVVASKAGEFSLEPSLYTLGARARGPLRVASSLADLEVPDLTGSIVLLRGEAAAEPFMPKDYPFYYPDHHRRAIERLEASGALGVVAAPPRAAASGRYPFTLFEDGNFALPSAFTSEEVGDALAALAGSEVSLSIVAERNPARARNVVARSGRGTGSRIVFCAHIDAKPGTPGALDNAAGVVTLLLLAEKLAERHPDIDLEFVVMNGEDNYSAAGELQYLAANEGRLDEIALFVNLDGLGYREGRTAYSLYGCPPVVEDAVRRALPEAVEGPPWFAGDHAVFVMKGRPAVALTSEKLEEVIAVSHSAADRPDLVDPARLVEAAAGLHRLVEELESIGIRSPMA
jgi:aminopeptidase YwaD